jgi:hypothetical protein
MTTQLSPGPAPRARVEFCVYGGDGICGGRSLAAEQTAIDAPLRLGVLPDVAAESEVRLHASTRGEFG